MVEAEIKPRANSKEGYFKPVNCKWVLIGNIDYSALRSLEIRGIKVYKDNIDINEAFEDMLNVRNNVKSLGGRDEDIVWIKNCDYNQLRTLFDKLMRWVTEVMNRQ